MNRFSRICFICILCIVSFTLGFFSKVVWLYNFSSKLMNYTKPQLVEEKLQSSDIQKDNLIGNSFENDSTVAEQNESIVAQNTATKIGINTEYYVYEYNQETNTGEMIAQELPDFLEGATREDITEYLSEYSKLPSLNDRKKGFININLLEFSKEKVVVEKIYNKKDYNEQCFYLKSEENYIVVFCADQRTVYQYTDIRYDTLPEETRLKIDQTLKLNNLDELYSFLESYTS